jgi:Ni2+-binding GTPase involved in maturation of urease and hydrogenase
MKNKLTVIVCGPPDSGKTTIAELIQKALDDHGIPAGLSDDSLVDTHAPFSQRLQALRARETTATVTCQQTNREGKTNVR